MPGTVRARLKLAKPVPNMVINPRQGLKIPTYNFVAQTLSTEGGNNYFNIFVSPDYGRDALYLFTPDVLAVMDKYGQNFAYRLKDDEMEIFAPGGVMNDTKALQFMIVLATLLAKQFDQQAVRYKDENATTFAQSHGQMSNQSRRMNDATTSGVFTRYKWWIVGIIVGLVAIPWLWRLYIYSQLQ
jgi:hypothetical protein